MKETEEQGLPGKSEKGGPQWVELGSWCRIRLDWPWNLVGIVRVVKSAGCGGKGLFTK